MALYLFIFDGYNIFIYLLLRWHMFIDIFEHKLDVTAIGPYISCEKGKHIQSFMLALDRRSVDLMEKTWRCPDPNEDRIQWILDTEVVICRQGLFYFLIKGFFCKKKTLAKD